jgi:hypothetical protein
MRTKRTGSGADIFSCRHDGPFILQAEEVAYGRFLPVDEALRLSLSEPFTPDGVEILRKIRDGGNV